MIYFDQAATSFPKPEQVITAMTEALQNIGGNAGRGEHSITQKAEDIVRDTRKKAAALFGCSDYNKCLFFGNATIALNQAIKGINWQEGDHVITTSMEHNSIRRPLEYIKKQNHLDITYLNWDFNEKNLLESLENKITTRTKLIAVTHASNVTGGILPLEAILRIAKKHNILTLVDASQTAGHLPLNMKNQGIDLLVFPGHKGLLGPQGTGMLLVEKEIKLIPLLHGGTGRHSESSDQPEIWPEKYESGTLNIPAIAGLLAAFLHYETNETEIVSRETILINKLLAELKNIKNVDIYWPSNQVKRLPIIAFNIRNARSQEVAIALDAHYQIAVRAGLHCSPLAHQTLNTLEYGVVRASLNMYNTEDEIRMFIKAITEIADVYEDF